MSASDPFPGPRPTTLNMLGLAPDYAIGIESFLKSDAGKYATGQDSTSEIIATALERLAAALRNKSASGMSIDYSTHLSADQILTHTLLINFIYARDYD